MKIEDIFDFNFEKPGAELELTGASRVGAQIQCGFNMDDSKQGAGEVIQVRVEVDGAMDWTGREAVMVN